MLRYRADLRTLAYLAASITLLSVQWRSGRFHPLLYALTLFLAVTVAVISHNHNHLGIWRSRWLNLGTSYVISVLYGFPAIGWVPTHNQVHHKLNNRPGDTSRSPKFFKRNHLAALLVYPTLTGMEQQREIGEFFRTLWKKNRFAFWLAASEYIVFFGFMVGIFVLDWRKALIYFLIPQQFALYMIQVFNYVQHVEADAESKWDHSRNFVSPLLNALLFNNGYHTVHHHCPGLHWSKTPALHERDCANIRGDLLVKSWWGYMFTTFFWPRPSGSPIQVKPTPTGLRAPAP